MLDPKIIERLHNSQDFLKFLNELHAVREYWIKQLHDLKTESLQQISGRILALDEVLFAAQYESLTEKWDRLIRSSPESAFDPSERAQYQSDQSERSEPAASGTGTAGTIADKLQPSKSKATKSNLRRQQAQTAVP
jgi:hypothetical protein